MKKLLLVLFVMAAIVPACNKEKVNVPVTGSGGSAWLQPDDGNRENGCGCSASCFWSSCSVTCPMTNGACGAACTCVNIWLFGIIPLGSGAACGCGGVGVGSGALISFTEEQIHHYNLMLGWIEGLNTQTMNQLRSKIQALLQVAGGNNNGAKAQAYSQFVQALQSITQAEGQYLSPLIETEKAACGSN